MLPEGEYLYKDLSSEFVDVDKLLNEIADEETSGYLSFESENTDERGFAVLERGEVGGMKIFRGGRERVEEGADAVEELLESGSYTVQVVDCNESAQEIVEIKLRNEEIKTDISTDDVNVPEFLATNITDQENDCHIILLSDEGAGVVTMVDGIPTQAKLSRDGEILVGNDALKEALGQIDQGRITIDIYQMSEEDEEEAREEARGDDIIGEQMEGELEGISDEFEDKADDLLDDMGLDFMGEEGESGEMEVEAGSGGDESEGESGGDDLGVGELDGTDDLADELTGDDDEDDGDGGDDTGKEGSEGDDDEDGELFDSIETEE